MLAVIRGELEDQDPAQYEVIPGLCQGNPLR